jgi:Ca-activated chloride channel family protein
MNVPLSLLSAEEVRRCIPPDDEAGFGALATTRGQLPLRSVDVQARIDGLVAQVSLAQTFVNAFAEPLEATYIFPLPDRAAVTRFRLEVGRRIVEGVLKERGAARREYDVAVRAGHRAAIAEEERPGVFTLRVGNVMPGESATVNLTLSGPVTFDAGEVTFRFPLVVAPRYIPSAPLPGPSVGAGTAVDTDAVPDASRISPPVLLPGYPNPVRLSLAVEVFPGELPLSDLRCSLHAAVAEPVRGGYRIVLGPAERLDRDFILRYRLGAEAVRTSLFLCPDRENRQEGTFALTLVPPLRRVHCARPRDVVFVLDRSGSMAGWKMVAARRALARMVDALTERDRFTVYAFDDQLETPPSFQGLGLVPATDRNRFRAIEHLAGIEARGGTEMARPLDLAVEQLKGERDRILVLVTDGQVGNEDQILRTLGKRLQNVRIFTLGIDQAVNEAFLKRLAALGGGCCDVVESEDRLDEVMAKLQRRVGTPLLTGLRLEAGGLKIDPRSVTPPRLPDLFAGTAVTIFGRYQGAAEGAVSLQGHDEAGRPWAHTIQGRLCENPAVAQAWARSQVRALEDRFVIGDGDPAALEKEIIALSLRFGVLCRFTAFVAVDRSEVVNEGGRQHQVTQPVELPAGWETQSGASSGALRSLGAPMAARPAKKVMLARQVLQEQNAEGAAPEPARPAGTPRPCAAPPIAPDVLRCDRSAGQADSGSRLSDEAVFEDYDDEECDEMEQPPKEWFAKRKAKRRQDLREIRKSHREHECRAAGARRSRSLLGKLYGAIFDRGPAEDQARESVGLTAYRRRALEMLEALSQDGGAPGPVRLRALGVLAMKLAALIADLKSVGAPAKVLQPLEKLHANLQQLVGTEQPAEAEVARLWSESEETLRLFSGVAASVAAPRK